MYKLWVFLMVRAAVLFHTGSGQSSDLIWDPNIDYTHLNVTENVPLDRNVFNISVENGVNLGVEYRIIKGEDIFTFRDPFNLQEVDVSYDGMVYPKIRIDYEENDKVLMTFEATRRNIQGVEIASVTRDVQVNINDINDEIPKFSQQIFAREIYEDTAVGATIFTFSVTDQELSNTPIQVTCNRTHPKMMKGYLKAKDINVQRRRIRQSIERVNPVSVAQRFAKTVSRRKYSVPMSNSLWHLDGHMKLIRWGISTHGGIDGHSRLITFLHADSDNKASTVLKHFISGCDQYGVPSRVRTDHGRENIMVALFINLLNGEERHSHIGGRSVHNQRIERLWRDVHTQVTEKIYNKFYELEDQGELDPENKLHILSLQAVFLPLINKQLEVFRLGWNNHALSTENNRTPHQIWLDGILGNLNTDTTPIRNIFGGTMSDKFKEQLRRHRIDPDSIQQNEVQVEELLTQEQINAMLEASEHLDEPVARYKGCLAYIFENGLNRINIT